MWVEKAIEKLVEDAVSGHEEAKAAWPGSFVGSGYGVRAEGLPEGARRMEFRLEARTESVGTSTKL